MKKIALRLLCVLPIASFSQDTLFNKKLSEVTVRSVSKKSTDLAVISTVRNMPSVSDGISIDYIKKTPDRSVSDALKRVSGVTIQNDKFVLVRGLADRYNSAWLNKTSLPSTEPDRRAFSFDIIPTAVIDNIIVIKSSAANLPGDWCGGLVQVSTKDVSEKFSNASFGVGVGSVSTFKSFKRVKYIEFPSTFPSTYTYRVSTNGDKRLFTKQIDNPSPQAFSSVPNANGSFTLGYKKNSWSGVFSAIARNTFSLNYIDRKDYQSSTELAYQYKDTLFSERFSTNGLLNVTRLEKNRYNWKTLFSYQKESSYLTRNGNNYDNVQNVLSNASNHVNNLLLNTQFDGKIRTLDFALGYNFTFRELPDYRVNPITKSLGINEPYATAWRDTYRFWSVMDENGFNSSVNEQFGKMKVGLSYVKKLRNFNARVFRYVSNDVMDEITNNTDRYKADFDLTSSYLMYEDTIGKVKLNTGIRVENNIFNVQTADFSGQKVLVSKNYLYVVPSINISRSENKTQVRLSMSKSLSRPEFREVANFAYYDFVRNAQILGNPKLEKTDIYNLDLKYEYYPRSGENFSVSLFGKRFVRPIEQIVADGSVPSNLLLSFTNPKSATLFGTEIEIRKKINSWIDVYSNCSFMSSEVIVNGAKRQLQGQSNYVINGGVNLKKNKNSLNLTYNRIGNRISAVGFQGYPDIFENSRDVFDVTLLRKLKRGEIKLAINDVFAQPTVLYQKINNRNLITTNNETTASITVNISI